MYDFVASYRRFRRESWPAQRQRFAALAAEGQKPTAMVIACIDSRADPATIFDARPGEILVVRNVANLVPPYAPDDAYHGTSAALEFGVRVLGVAQIIVMGHGKCGGIEALLSGVPDAAPDFVAGWISLAEPARVKAMRESEPDAQRMACEQEVVRLSLSNLMTFPWIAEAVEAGRLTLQGAWFAIDSGRLEVLQADGSFAPVQD